MPVATPAKAAHVELDLTNVEFVTTKAGGGTKGARGYSERQVLQTDTEPERASQSAASLREGRGGGEGQK